MSTTWKSIIVGVDASAAAVGAAEVAVRMANAAGSRCYLVHATPEVWPALATAQWPEQIEQMRATVEARARRMINAALESSVPAELRERLIIGFGRAPVVFRDAARETGAELIVLGGKQHSMLGRWFVGSTCHDVIRTGTLPVLVTRGDSKPIRRVLAAADLSSGAQATLQAAERMAALFAAELRVVSILEPLPSMGDLPAPIPDDYERLVEEQLKRDVWPLVRYPGATTVLRHGAAAAGISIEAAAWPADLVVVGSHGKNWFDRVLIGSVTERLLNHLPASLLVVPVGAAAPVTSVAAAAGQQVPQPAGAIR
jgi:nucleotide-binding universal stress UspA family protein